MLLQEHIFNQLKTRAMNLDIAIFKIGGHILGNREYLNSTISQLTSLYERNHIRKIVIIAGGGSSANLIRKLDKKFNFDNTTSHLMAIYTMDLNGIKISNYFPKLLKTDDLNHIISASKIFTVFLPYEYLKETDELPHNWEVTSDSITLYLAYKFKIENCFLIKNVDGIIVNDDKIVKDLTTKEYIALKESGKLANLNLDDEKKESRPIDPYLIKLIDEYRIPCVILNGSSSSLRILKYFKISDTQKKIYTKIKFS